jgi:hypothetical protein
MKQSNIIRSLIGMVLVTMAVLLMTLILQVPAHGEINCTIVNSGDDADCDGFISTQETGGITLTDSTNFPGSSSTGTARGNRLGLDVPAKDLFVVVVPLASGSLFPADPLATLTSAASEMGISVHRLTTTQVPSNRVIGSTKQRAIRVEENSTTGGNMGVTVNPGWGATNLPDLSLSAVKTTVYSSQVSQWITTNCPSPGCKVWDNPTITVSNTDLVKAVAQHVVAHESGHQMRLRGSSDSTYGYHYVPCSGSGTCKPNLMQQSIFLDSNKVLWFGKNFQTSANYGTPATTKPGGYKTPTEDLDSVTLLKKYCYYTGQVTPQTKTECTSASTCTLKTGGTCTYP